jgi:hypothetical protein
VSKAGSTKVTTLTGDPGDILVKSFVKVSVEAQKPAKSISKMSPWNVNEIQDPVGSWGLLAIDGTVLYSESAPLRAGTEWHSSTVDSV